jgi:hypothetical protein
VDEVKLTSVPYDTEAEFKHAAISVEIQKSLFVLMVTGSYLLN